MECIYSNYRLGDKMIVDVTGIELTPGEFGKDCLGNGKHEGIECCCDECDYFLCCIDKDYRQNCIDCESTDCVRSGKKSPEPV